MIQFDSSTRYILLLVNMGMFVCVCNACVKSKHFHGIVSSNLAFFLPDCSTNNARNKGENKRNIKRVGNRMG